MKLTSILLFITASLILFSCRPVKDTETAKHVITSTELTEIIKQKDYSLVYFWTTWCGPCRKTLLLTLPILEKSLDTSRTQLLVVAVSGDEEKIKSIIHKSMLKAQKFQLAFTGPDVYLTHKLVLKNTLENLFPDQGVWNNSVPVSFL